MMRNSLVFNWDSFRTEFGSIVNHVLKKSGGGASSSSAGAGAGANGGEAAPDEFAQILREFTVASPTNPLSVMSFDAPFVMLPQA